MALYKCPHCGKRVTRKSMLKRLKSYCDRAGRVINLVRIG